MSRVVFILAVLLALPLAGCGNAKFQAFGKCRLMALKEVKSISDNDLAQGKAGDFTAYCMQAKGYDIDWQRGGCRGIDTNGPANEDCYYRRWF